MPENYYCLDNFFQKMTDLESPRKNNDCYFYYYSTCTKGDNCTFRHEPSALGCETTCSFWKEGKCVNVRCNFRHMELRKNRKTIPCYWESQPSGCKKPHCPFMHVSKKNIEGDENENLGDGHDEICNVKSKKDEFTEAVVDPIVVNFEEESDNESSTPTQTSHHNSTQQSYARSLQAQHAYRQLGENKAATRPKAPLAQSVATAVEVKTLEEIKLDRIQAESAAYYSYSDELTPKVVDKDSANGRRSIFKRLQPLGLQEKPKEVDIQDVQVLTLDEIRRRKRKNQVSEQAPHILESTAMKRQKAKIELAEFEHEKGPQLTKEVILRKPKPYVTTNVAEICIKTLAEIKAEKQLKRKLENSEDDAEDLTEQINKKELPSSKKVRILLDKEPDEQEVSSTSKMDEIQLASTNITVQEAQFDQSAKVQCVVAPTKRHIDAEKNLDQPRPHTTQPKSTLDDDKLAEDLPLKWTVDRDELKNVQHASTNNSDANCRKAEDSRLDDLLLDEDDDDTEVGSLTLKAEDDILNDIDDLLNE